MLYFTKIRVLDMDTVKLKFDNNGVKEYKKNTTLYEISKDYKSDFDILGAKVDNVLASLNDKVTKDATVKFIDFCDLAGYKMYQAGLKFIFEVALKTVFPDLEVHYEHSVPKGILAEVTGGKILTNEDIATIKGEMAHIIDEDLKFEKYNIEKRDIIEFYRNNNESEKARNIENISDEVLQIYKLRNNLNFFYTEMPYSTGAINKFDIVYLGKNRIIFLFPSKRTNGQIPEYVHYDNIIKSFLEGKKWLNLMKVPYVADLNELVSSCKISNLIEANELLFEKKISDVVDEITDNPEKKIILIAGPSSSGKTTTMKKLSSYLKVKGIKPIGISIDDYFVDREKTPKDEHGEYDYECLLAIDIEKFNQDLTDLLNNKEVNLPTFDFITGKRKYEDNYCKLDDNSIIVIEGLHALNDDLTPLIPDNCKYKIYLSPFIPLNIDRHNYISTVDLRLLRRIIRDNRTRGLSVSDTICKWQSVRGGEEKYIFPYIHQADVIINTAFAYELGVMKVFVEPLLYSVKPDSPYYEESSRLLRFLKSFLPIPAEYISEESILREFIGYGLWKGRS